MPSLLLSPSPLSRPLRSSVNQTTFFFNNSRNSKDYDQSRRGKLILFTRVASSDSNSAKNLILEASNIVDKDDRLPEKVSNFVKGSGRLPTELELEEENEGLIDNNVGIATRMGVNSIDLVEKSGGFSLNGEIGNSDSVKRIGKLRVLDLLERIRTLPTGHQAKIIDIFEEDGGFLTITDFNSLLVALVKADEYDFAMKLFDELPSHGFTADSQTFSIMIRCYCKKNDPHEAKRVLGQMMETGYPIPPNVVTFTILINSFCKRGKLQQAFEVLELMNGIGCQPTVQTYNCLINGLCYVGRVEEAYELLMKIKKSSQKPDIYTYTAVMDGFCKVGRSDEAMELLEEALEIGLKPSVVTYNTLFNGYCKEGRPMEGINVLKQMKERGCQPDYISYSTLLHGLLKWSEVSSAMEIYKEMLEIGFEVDERMMNTLVRGICRRSWTEKEMLEDAEEVFDKIRSMDYGIYPYTYCLMIQALSIGKETEKALVCLHEMVKMGYPARTTTFNAVIQALCVEGRVNEALHVLVLMFEAGKIPGRISYTFLIREFNRQGRLLGAYNVYGAALKRGVIPRRTPKEYLIDKKSLLGDMKVQEM